jgi:hypothetical protein
MTARYARNTTTAQFRGNSARKVPAFLIADPWVT